MSGWVKPCLLAWGLAVEPPQRAAVVVDASTLAESDAGLESMLEDALGAVLWELEVQPRRHAEDPILWVQVTPEPDGYAFTIKTGPRSEETPRQSKVCSACDREALRVQLETAVRDVVAELPRDQAAVPVQQAVPPPPVAPVPLPEPRRVRELPSSGGPPPREDRRIMRRAAIGLLVAGGSITVGGIILANAGSIDVSYNYATEDRWVRYREVGYGALASGAVIAVVGGILLAVDARKHRASARRSGSVAALRPFSVRFSSISTSLR